MPLLPSSRPASRANCLRCGQLRVIGRRGSSDPDRPGAIAPALGKRGSHRCCGSRRGHLQAWAASIAAGAASAAGVARVARTAFVAKQSPPAIDLHPHWSLPVPSVHSTHCPLSCTQSGPCLCFRPRAWAGSRLCSQAPYPAGPLPTRSTN